MIQKPKTVIPPRMARERLGTLTHLATLFTIVEADVTASSLRATRQLVTGLTGREVRRGMGRPAGHSGTGGQAPARRCDRVAFAGVRLLPGAELVQFGLEGGAVDGWGPAGVG